MSLRTLRLVPVPVAALVLTAALAPTASQDREVKDSNLKALAKSLGEYVEAKAEKKNVIESEAAVKEALDKLEKKLKGRDPLSLTGDLGQALWLSRAYEKQRVSKGKVKDEVYENNFMEDGLPYAVWAPSKYSAKKGPYPVIITITDEGLDPKQHITEDWISSDIRDNAIIVAPSMPEDTKMWSERGDSKNLGGRAHLLLIYKVVSESYAIDFDRVFLAGKGAGVAAALALAEGSPDRFAGVIGRSGDAGDTPAANFRNLATYFAGAGANATAFQAKCDELEYKNSTIDPAGKEEDIWKWMQENKRSANPADITLVPTPFPNSAYWLRVPVTDGLTEQRIDATIDRDTNTITVDSVGVTDVEIYFNDVLIDLDQPVKVVLNGAEYLDKIPRSFSTTLDCINRVRSDPGKLYVAVKSYAAPANKKTQ